MHLGSEADIHVDSVVADAEYAPNTGLAVASSTITRNTAVLNVSGSFHPHRVVSRRGVVSYAWDNDLGSRCHGEAGERAGRRPAADRRPAGEGETDRHREHQRPCDRHSAQSCGLGQRYVSRTARPTASRIRRLLVDISAQGTQINATRLLVQAHDMAIHGSGSYDIASKHVAAHITGNNLRLSKFQLVQNANPDADAVVSLNVDADGTIQEPNLRAQVQLADITYQRKKLGVLTLNANSVGSTVNYQIQSTLVGAQIAANGHTSLQGDYVTQAQMTLTGVNVANLLDLVCAGLHQGKLADQRHDHHQRDPPRSRSR